MRSDDRCRRGVKCAAVLFKLCILARRLGLAERFVSRMRIGVQLARINLASFELTVVARARVLRFLLLPALPRAKWIH